MPETILTGNTLSNCRKCGTSARFRLDDRWQYDEDAHSAYNVVAYNFEPKFCPVCGSDEVEITSEEVNYWEFCARSASWRVAPETLALVEELYKTWERGDVSFIQFLVDFKASVAIKEPA